MKPITHSEAIDFFFDRFIREPQKEGARMILKRLHNAEEMTRDQKKKLHSMRQHYKEFDVTFELVEGAVLIIPLTIHSEWARGILFRDKHGQIQYQTRSTGSKTTPDELTTITTTRSRE